MAHVHEATEFAGVNVRLTGADYVTPAKNAERELAAEGFAAKLAAKDATLWGPDAQEEAAIRLGWLDLPRTSWQYIPQLAE
ncbi:MAG TPA: glucose-6-phosphate isomerase, partial [Acidothermaceae bacterium]|nr:glucose-6-phosphate isomerase [Acidothermaceae bacterium]